MANYNPHTRKWTGTFDQASLDDLLRGRFRNPRLASAIVMAESRGDPNARSKNPDGGENVGLFQVDTLTAIAHGLDPNRLEDPQYNAYAAQVISHKGANWNAWETFVNGAYKKFMDGEKLPNADSAGPFGIPIDNSASNPVGKGGDLNPGDWTGSLGHLLSNLVSAEWWANAGKVILGVIALVLGVYLFSQQFKAGRTVKSAAVASVI